MPINTTQPRLHTDEQVEAFHRQGWYGQRLLVDYLDGHAADKPGKTAIIEANSSLTYAEVVRLSENLAASLQALGVSRGDVVAIAAPNWSELPLIHFAADRIGAIFLPLSAGFREKELTHLLAQSQARVLFCPADIHGFSHLDLVRELRTGLPQLRHVVSLRSDAASLAAGADDTFSRMSEDDSWRTPEGLKSLLAARGTADEPSHVMVSSGTTGMPRCSLFSDNNTLVKLLQQYVPAAQVGPDDIAAALAPAGTGATGYNYPILCMLLLGGTSVMLEHWSSSQIDQTLALIERNGCTMAVMVPAQLASLVQAAERTGFSHRLRVITNSGAKLPSSVAEAAERAFGCRVQSIYGSSEAGATAMTRVDDTEEKRRFTVGKPLAGQDVGIVADDGSNLPPGEVGEVCWRGANKSYGFLQDRESSEKVWSRDGWLHSGDLGMIDAQGYLQIVGRKKEMIIRGGQNINPGAIEELLLRHPDVAEIAIVPFEDPILGERIAACVVARKSCCPTLESLKSFVLVGGLAAWHQPEMLLEMSELPRNAGGKVDKKALSQRAGQARQVPA